MSSMPLSASQLALLQQISTQGNSDEPEVSPEDERLMRLSWAQKELPVLHAMGEEQSANAAFKEWNEFCDGSVGDTLDEAKEELGIRLDETYALSVAAAEKGKKFHFSAHFGLEIMLWSQEHLEDLEEEDAATQARLRRIFDGAYDYLAALAQHNQALERERDS